MEDAVSELLGWNSSSPPFYLAKWGRVAAQSGLIPSLDLQQLATFTIPRAHLPPSFHRHVLAAASDGMDVNREYEAHTNEEARVRAFQPRHAGICSLFKGRIVDKPDHPLRPILETAGGEAQHQLFLFNSFLLVITEMGMNTSDKNFQAQILLQLKWAFSMNRDLEIIPPPPVYGVLSDLRRFIFISYDGNEFRRLETHTLPVDNRKDFFGAMVPVTEIIFSLILDSLIRTLESIISTARSENLQSDTKNLYLSPDRFISPYDEHVPIIASFEECSRALSYAREARDILVNCDLTDLNTWERDGERGLTKLQASMECVQGLWASVDWQKDSLHSIITEILSSQCVGQGSR